jgi:hypothetical protein
VPLLQIAPSKTDTERLLLVSPELADILSMVISRRTDFRDRFLFTGTDFDTGEQTTCID